MLGHRVDDVAVCAHDRVTGSVVRARRRRRDQVSQAGSLAVVRVDVDRIVPAVRLSASRHVEDDVGLTDGVRRLGLSRRPLSRGCRTSAARVSSSQATHGPDAPEPCGSCPPLRAHRLRRRAPPAPLPRTVPSPARAHGSRPSVRPRRGARRRRRSRTMTSQLAPVRFTPTDRARRSLMGASSSKVTSGGPDADVLTFQADNRGGHAQLVA